MTCVHLRRLYQLFQQEGVKLSAPDLIHVVCPQCGEKEVCPSMLMGDTDEAHQESDPGRPLTADSEKTSTGSFPA